MRSIQRLFTIALAALSLTGLFSGCDKAPDQERAAAKAAINAAREAEADKYMPNNFANVEKAFEAAENEITLQNGTFALSRNYKKARALLNNVTQLATDLKNEAPDKKAAVIKQIEDGLTLSEKKIKETRAEIKKAPRRAFSRETRASMLDDVNKADSAIAQATEEFKAGNYIEARNRIGDSERFLKKINDRLSTGDGMSLM